MKTIDLQDKEREKAMLKFFVYGTLKKGYGNHRLLEAATFIKEATVEGMSVFDGPGFPYAYTEDGIVKGEIYEVDARTALNLDALEGYPHHYDRKVITTTDGDEAWMYYIHRRPSYEKINSGIWSR